MITRTVTGLIAAVFTTWLVLWGPSFLQVATVLAGAGISCLEFDRLFFQKPSPYRQLRGLCLVLLSVLTLRSAPEMAWVFFWLPLCVLAVAHVRRANSSGQIEGEIRELSIELLQVVYIVCAMGFILPILNASPYGREFLLLLFFLVFSGDTFAYFVGTLWGKHRLASQISPKKSLEGAAGAIVGAMLFALIWLQFVYSGPRPSFFLTALFLLAPFISVLAQVGDLFESMLKRGCARKDSGQFLPGHGGFLDRIDGLTLSAPAFYFFLRYVLERL